MYFLTKFVELENDGESLRTMSIAGSRERLTGAGTGSADSERRQSSGGPSKESASLQNSSSRVLPPTAPIIGSQRSLSAEGLSAVRNNVASTTSQNLSESASRAQQPVPYSNRRRFPSFGSPGVPLGSAGSTSADDTDLQIITSPTHILRLQSTGSDETREVVELAGLHCHGTNLFVHVETTAPPPRRSQPPKPTKEAFKSPKDGAGPLYDGDGSMPSETRASSVPGSADSKGIPPTTSTDVPDWLQKEFDEAEHGSAFSTSMVRQQGQSSSQNMGQRTFSVGSSIGSHSGGMNITTGFGAIVPTTDDDDMSSFAVADDELEDDVASVGLTTTDADDDAVSIRINSHLARAGEKVSTAPAGVRRSSNAPPPRKAKPRSGIPPSGHSTSGGGGSSAGDKGSKRNHQKSLSLGGGPIIGNKTSASSSRPPFSGGKTYGKNVQSSAVTPPSSSSQRSSRAMEINYMNSDTFGFPDSSPSSTTNSATTKVETMVRELEERYRAEREQIRREAEEAVRVREKQLQQEIDMLRSQLATQNVQSSQSTASLPVSNNYANPQVSFFPNMLPPSLCSLP